jgi:hypothetical protein
MEDTSYDPKKKWFVRGTVLLSAEEITKQSSENRFQPIGPPSAGFRNGLAFGRPRLLSIRLEVKPERQLANAMTVAPRSTEADGIFRLSELRIGKVPLWRGKLGMVEDIEEVRKER